MTVTDIISKHPETDPKWWKEAVVYQVYPASFKDSNDDGWGDIKGINSKLEYIKELGADTIWISPFYDSPQEDMGYDIADYEKVWPRYGTNDDIFNLIENAHSLGIKIVVDLVINHCSSQHAWFQEARSSLNNAKRDWFIWKAPKGFDCNGKPIPPNNWGSFFGGSAWQYDEGTGEFYLHLFAKGQPDFNWENEEARNAIYESSVGFWLDHGVDGFRIDVGGLYSKKQDFSDAPVTKPGLEFQTAESVSMNGPRIHEFHKEMNKFMRDRVKDGRELLNVGEIMLGSEEVLRQYTSAKEQELSQLFIFDHTLLGRKPGNLGITEFKLPAFKNAIAKSFSFTNKFDSWSTIYLENHDQPRSVTRFGDDSPAFRKISAKLLALLEIALTGTLYVYQGQELGMINFKNWPIEKFEDIEVRGTSKMLIERYGVNSEQVKEYFNALNLICRDHARTPFPWASGGPFGGFTNAKEPWFPLTETFQDGINAEDELKDPASVFHFWKKAIEVRRAHKDVLNYGYDFTFVDRDNEKLFAFTKKYGEKLLYVVLNFSREEIEFSFLEGFASHEFIFGNYAEAEIDTSSNVLKPWEGRLYYARGP
ncbi:unnamed protein product [Kluyveromyces dobzhanskii CBS 2104]|uniref:WGS project CCBQ000000000 data, contig 00073 n=1 Tax=Kluyveromyces dobzhanskii CBS 2104 TaxID=1427455 RepID=A0A0A8LC00_9SACH|nr:unnamed protein product [Kluyveromyces dobzhanskii CBS 2104]